VLNTAAHRIVIEVMQDGAQADGSEENRVQVRITGPADRPEPGRSVVFEAGEGAQVVACRVVTNRFGIAGTGVVGHRVGPCTVAITVEGDGVRHEAAVRFTKRRGVRQASPPEKPEMPKRPCKSWFSEMKHDHR
jgi:hypothetical protein